MAKLHTREILDYERSCRPVCSERLTGPLGLKPGDHLHWCHIGSWSDGIVISVSPGVTATNITCIRYRHVFGSGMVVRQEVRSINFASDRVYVYNYEDHSHSPTVVLTRARACLGQRGYNALRNNNDDFCRWCKSGKQTYLCINETFLCPGIDDETKQDNGAYCTTISTLDGMNQGDHISWLLLYYDSRETKPGWKHGIVLDVDQKSADVISFSDTSHSINIIKFTCWDFTDHKVHRYVYERCHMPEDVLARARSRIDALIFPEMCERFVIWCKLGIPSDSDAVDKIVIAAGSQSKLPKDGEGVNVKKEAGVIGARTAATTVARTVEGVTAKVAVETAAKQVPRALVRGAAEGAAAAAAVGVEAVVLAYDVGMTYRSFSRREITKDELQGQNIHNSIRGASAATASVAGGAAGAAVGSLIFPGVGTFVGGIIGGVVGGISGQIGGHYAGKGIASLVRRPYENLFVENDVEIVENT